MNVHGYDTVRVNRFLEEMREAKRNGDDDRILTLSRELVQEDNISNVAASHLAMLDGEQVVRTVRKALDATMSEEEKSAEPIEYDGYVHSRLGCANPIVMNEN